MADEAPAENAPAAEGAGTNEIYINEDGYHLYEVLTTLEKAWDTTWSSIPGTKRYMTGTPGSWGGYNGVLHGPHLYEETPLSVQTILEWMEIPREETMRFEGREKVKPFPKYSMWLLEEEKVMPFLPHSAWSGGKEELPSMELWGPDGPPSHYASFYPAPHRGTGHV